MKTTDFNQTAVYVGTYGKYNNGSIAGEWLTLSDYSDREEFYEACAELHADEEDPEYMFQDWEYISDALIGESWISEKFWELKDELENNSINEDAFFVYLEMMGYKVDKEDVSDLISRFEDAFHGEYDSEEDYAEEYMKDCYEIPSHLENYIDYGAFARDLFMGDFYFEDGYVFSRY